MANKNYISILITNYNKEKFLDKSLKNVCNQNFKNYEIIVFDDCSTDRSVDIIKKYKKVRLIVNKSKNKKNSGPLNQINGIIESFKKSKGNIICLLDADDYFKKNNLSDHDEIYFYTDSHNDLKLLEYCTKPVAVDPDETLNRICVKNSWEIISLR